MEAEQKGANRRRAVRRQEERRRETLRVSQTNSREHLFRARLCDAQLRYGPFTTTVMRLAADALTDRRTEPELRPRVANMLE